MSHPHPEATAGIPVPAEFGAADADPAAASPRTAALVAEAFGTLLLVLAIVGTALFSTSFLSPADGSIVGVGFLGIAVAAGLALVVASYTFGPLSGGHFNPAVTVGLAAAGRFPWQRVGPYVVAQVVGGLVATTLVVLVGLAGPDGWLTAAQDGGFASNGWGPLSPAGFDIGAAIVVETLFAALLVMVVLGVTHPSRGAPALAGIIIGFAYAVVHVVTLPVDLAGVNPARSIATAIYGGGDAVAQLWVFLVFPVLGALAAGFAYRALFDAPAPRR